ncbi:hypothetical protein L484_008269 [Morus notabilis]|uniref:Uncharacterized protein n=1 Tax=Morus notabilis TaxID=981085 RepID=W9R489_9ROSA|nr:hypothetical protein L484_008269 [Morus notabilis]
MVKASHICLFFILIIVSHELLSVEARTLKKNVKLVGLKDAKPKAVVAREVASPRQLHRGVKDQLDGVVSAFRPTNPGHSPGVGHSIHN